MMTGIKCLDINANLCDNTIAKKGHILLCSKPKSTTPFTETNSKVLNLEMAVTEHMQMKNKNFYQDFSLKDPASRILSMQPHSVHHTGFASYSSHKQGRSISTAMAWQPFQHKPCNLTEAKC